MREVLDSLAKLPTPSTLCRQIVVLTLRGRAFGVDVRRVREIRGWQPTTELPHAPNYVLGIVNLRGAIVPVFDLQARLGFGPNCNPAAGVVIVVEIGDRFVGFLSDSVSDIIDIGEDDLRPAPDYADGHRPLLHGLAVKNDDIVGLLDLDAVTDATRLAMLDA